MIKNIIFDFGGVFINLDKEATMRMMIKMGFAGITPEMMDLFKAFETGIISTDIFLERAREWVPKANTKQLVEAWNAILLDFPEYRLQFLEGLAKEERYRLFLLSNTNALHIDRVIEKMGIDRYQRFMRCFEYCYYSHEIHMRKPDPEIFEYLIDQNKLVPEHTLFIDDTEEHSKTAQELGIQVWHLQVGAEDIVDLKRRFYND